VLHWYTVWYDAHSNFGRDKLSDEQQRDVNTDLM